ncbi:hypothetical protein BFP72_05960 [Reichenbachiella sp. 5M10]|uniref:hypothetical protein n=1 Tax=Reichenbachiella sp. 5M10 TaxID=1889772 RepID=UPI000C1601C3|nr:hypothetical protein [Reichenbachiella sp. 5M10]PIB34967.1 hypothetical protein BFP72_05960 [Reichenbachiella sp. 5M10]
MTYLFETYQELIQSNNISEGLEQRLSEVSTRIINTIDEELFGFQTQERAVFYVQKIELAITNHISSIEQASLLSECLSRQKQLATGKDSLLEIQSHLERFYAVYRDPQKPVNEITIAHVVKDLRLKEKSLEAALLRNQINEKLIDIILYPVRSLKDNNRASYVSQDCIDYLLHFVAELEKQLDGFGNIREHQLIQHLYVLNFNNMALLTYLCEDYQKLKLRIEDEGRLLEHLQLQLNRLNHLPEGFKRPYNADLADLKLQAQQWMEQEITILKKKVKRNEKKLKRESKGSKLKFNLSVDVVTCFFRLLKETEVIDVGANEIIRWINQNISSKNQVDISLQSIQRKFFEKHPNRQPIEQLIAKLQDCVTQH